MVCHLLHTMIRASAVAFHNQGPELKDHVGDAMNSNIAASMMILSVLVIPTMPESIGPTAPESTDELVRPLPITMSEAVETAEAVIPGQAVEAQLAIADEGRPVYEVHMLRIDQSLLTVQVGAEDGQVVVIDENKPTDEDEMVQAGKGGSI